MRDIQRRTGLLVGRRRELSEIAAFAMSGEGYQVIVGDAWAGKTALLAEAVLTGLPHEVEVVAYFLFRREADADSTGFLAAVIPQLAYLLGEESRSLTRHNFLDMWDRAAERIGRDGRHLLLVVDGLDADSRLSGLPSVAQILPSAAGDRTHVLVTRRPHPQVPIDVPPGHPLLTAPTVELKSLPKAQQLARLAQQELVDLANGIAAD